MDKKGSYLGLPSVGRYLKVFVNITTYQKLKNLAYTKERSMSKQATLILESYFDSEKEINEST